MNSDKLAGRLGLVSPTLALRYEDRPEAFEGLIAVEGGSAFLPDGSPNPDYQRKLDQPSASLDDIETCSQRQPGPSVYAPSER